MSSVWMGERLRVSVFGESHGPAIGAVADGLPDGEALDVSALAAFMARRAPGGALSTPRREADAVRVLSGVKDGVTTGAPLAVLIENTNARSRDYETFRRVPRPSHADYPALLRYHGHADLAGGGHFSGRLTAPLCAAGGLCLQMLARRGVTVGAHLQEVAGIPDAAVDGGTLTREALRAFDDDLLRAYEAAYPPRVVLGRMREVAKNIACCFEEAQKPLKAVHKAGSMAAYADAVSRLFDDYELSPAPCFCAQR